MADMTTIKERIAETIYPNGTGAIKAEAHQALLLDMVDDFNAKKQDAEKGKGLVSDAERMAWNNKADKTGRYPAMSVGFANDLVGRGESIPAEFSFRASGGKSIKDGAARIKRLKGNSVVWNQLIPNPTAVHSKDETTAFNDGTRIDKGHQYLLFADIDGDNPYISASIYTLNQSIVTLYNQEAGYKFFSTDMSLESDGTDNANEGNIWQYFYFPDGQGTGSVKNVRLIDLTREFGAGNEPTTVEEYYARKPIVEDEYAYNEGIVLHMTAEGIKSVGDNAWDEEWKYDGSYVVAVNSVRVLPNTEYYVSSPDYVVISAYDKNDTLLATYERKNNVFTTPANASYLRLRLSSSYGTTYKNDIMITLVHSGWKQDTDAGYQPYWEDRLMFDERIKEHFPDGMKKWDMVYNKNGKGYIVKGTGVRAYEDGDAEDATVITDGSSTIYELSTPEVIEYDEPFNLDYRVADFGTEEVISDQPSAPIAADIIYQFNAVDMIRELWLKVQELEARLNG